MQLVFEHWFTHPAIIACLFSDTYNHIFLHLHHRDRNHSGDLPLGTCRGHEVLPVTRNKPTRCMLFTNGFHDHIVETSS
jgi:hypothetical protein